MSEMSDLFDSLDAGDLDEIAGKLNVNSLKEEECLDKEDKKKLDKIPAQLEKSTKMHAKQAKDLKAVGIGEEKKERKYVKFDALNEQIADLFNNSEFPEEHIAVPKPQAKAPQRKPQQSFVENAAKALSHQVKNTPKYEAKPLRETISVEERIRLVEQDLFRVQAQATPNTLVAGIGASLDSGGGAVWLWDLEDVNIGTPLNGTYPSITNGAVLKYNAASGQWIPGSAGSSAAGTVTTDDVNLVNPLTAEILAAALQTLPTPSGGVSTQTDANQWFKDSILYLDEAIGGENGNLELTGNLDFTGTTASQSLRKFNNSTPVLKIELGSISGDTVETFKFTQGYAESSQPLHLVAPATDTTGILRVNATGDTLNIFKVNAAGARYYRGAIVERPTDAGYIQDSYQIKGVKTAGASSTALLTVDYATDITTTPDTIQYLGQILSDNDLATKKYVDDNAGGGASEGWNTTGVTNLTGPADIRLTESNNALRFLNSDGSLMFRLEDTNDNVEFSVSAEFNQGLHIGSGKDIVLDGSNSRLLMKDGQGTAFELSDDGGNVFLRANTAGSEGLIFYQDLSDTSSATRVKFRAYEPPGGSHFYLTTADADSLDFIDKTTDEIYLRFNTSSKKLQIVDADIELDVAGVTNTASLETLIWNVANNTGAYASGKVIINDNDVDSFDIENEAFPNAPHIRFRTNTDDQASVFYQPLWIGSNKEVLLDPTGAGTATFNCLTTFTSDVLFASTSNETINFGAADGSSARSVVAFNRRLANTAGQIDFSIKGYRAGENTVKDFFVKKDNNPATEGDEILYYGETSDDKSIQTKESVNALIGAGGGGVSFTFKGAVDVTAANPPAGVAAGDYYANSTAGTAGANWTGIAGDTIGLNQLVIYKADGNWVAGGGVSGAYLPITGGTVTGDTTFDEDLAVKKDLTVGSNAEIKLFGDGNPGLMTLTTGLFTGGVAVNHTTVDATTLFMVAAASTTELFVVRGDGTVSVGTDLNTADTAADAVTLAPTGNITSTGTVTIANSGATNALIIKDGSTTTAQIFKGGAATFTGAVTSASFKNANNSFNVNGSGNITANAIIANGQLSVYSDSVLTGNVIVGSVAQEYYFHQFGTFEVRDSNNNAKVKLESDGTTTIAGDTTIGTVAVGVQSNLYGNVKLKAAGTGVTGGNFSLKNISDVDTLILDNDGTISTHKDIRFNNTTTNQNIRAFGNAAKTLTLEVSNSTATSPADNLFTQNLILSETGNVTNGNLTVNGGVNDKVIFKRGSGASGFVWDIEGTTEADNTDGTQRLLSVFRNTPGSASDAIGYYGRVSGDANIQTKASVEALIAATPAGANILKGGTIKKTGGSTSTSGNLARSEEHTSELQSPCNLVCRLLLEKKKSQYELHTI